MSKGVIPEENAYVRKGLWLAKCRRIRGGVRIVMRRSFSQHLKVRGKTISAREDTTQAGHTTM